MGVYYYQKPANQFWSMSAELHSEVFKISFTFPTIHLPKFEVDGKSEYEEIDEERQETIWSNNRANTAEFKKLISLAIQASSDLQWVC